MVFLGSCKKSLSKERELTSVHWQLVRCRPCFPEDSGVHHPRMNRSAKDVRVFQREVFHGLDNCELRVLVGGQSKKHIGWENN